MKPQNRPIREDEVAVIVEALRAAPIVDDTTRFFDTVASLRVVGRCACGCASVDFIRDTELGTSVRLADGIGTTGAGGTVGVLVWASGDRLSGLEIYDLGAGDDDQSLPVPGSIRPFDGEGSPSEPIP